MALKTVVLYSILSFIDVHKRCLPLPLPPPSPSAAATEGRPMHRTARDMEARYADTRIVKRLSASQAGAIKLARRYGDALVCVRYRHDLQGRLRYTTVELVVD